jgi:hypothetical protein
MMGPRAACKDEGCDEGVVIFVAGGGEDWSSGSSAKRGSISS